MNRNILILMFLSVITKVIGFIRDIILSYFYGTSGISDAFIVSITIPAIIFEFIGVGIATGIIPMYNKIKDENCEEVANSFIASILNWSMITCLVVCIICITFTNEVVFIFASGFKKDVLDIAIKFTKITSIGILFSCFIYIFTSFLQLKKEFIIPAIVSIPLNIVTIIGIMFSKKTTELLLPISFTLGMFSQCILLIPFIEKNGYLYKVKNEQCKKYIKTMLKISMPIIIGVSVNQINILIDRTLASNFSGGISALNYASKLNLFIQGIFVTSIVSVIFPRISELITLKKTEELKQTIQKSIGIINLFIIPITLGTMIFSKEIVELLFKRGEFDRQAMMMTSLSLYFYSIGMIGFALREVIVRIFYAMQDSQTPTKNAFLGVVLNIVLNITLSKYMGVSGLAFSTSLSAIFTTILLFFSLKKTQYWPNFKGIMKSFIKVFISSVIMAFFVKNIFFYLKIIFGTGLALVIDIGFGGIIYFSLIYIMKVSEARSIISLIVKKDI